MKIVIQRVSKAKVINKLTNEKAGEISEGLFVLLGIKRGDDKNDVDKLVNKLVKLRLMADKNSKMNLSIQDTSKNILLVSQFTLYANTKDGNRPSFIDAEEPEKAKEMYEYFIQKLKDMGVNVQIGCFGDYMKIETVLDGPVTIVLEN